MAGTVNRRSVRFRVTAVAVAVIALLLTAVAVALLFAQHRILTAALDDSLRVRADDLEAIAVASVPVALAGSGDDDAAQIVGGDGIVLVSSPNLLSMDAIAPDPGDVETIGNRYVVAPDDEFRVLSRSIQSPDGRAVLHVAVATDDVSDSVAVLRTSLAIAFPLAVVALGAIIWWIAGRALEPVERIRAEVAAIGETDLSRRVPVPATGDEIASLAGTMNGMLDRIERAVSRLQQFTADASHELRSPLTRIRSEIEVDLARPEDADLIATHTSVLEDVVALQEMVDDLLYLARSDAGRQPIGAVSVDLDDLILAEADRLRLVAGHTIDVSRVSGGQVVGDRAQLARAVRNLVDNAIRHAASTVTVEVGEDGSHVLLAVTDDGPGIPPGAGERVFERFTRLDAARSRDEGGSGLGLAIARDVIERHGGRLELDTSYAAGARFLASLPRSG